MATKKRALPWGDGVDADMVRELRKDTDYRVIRFAGHRWHFMLTGYGVDYVEQRHAIRVIDALNQLSMEALKGLRAAMRIPQARAAIVAGNKDLESMMPAQSEASEDDLFDAAALMMQAKGKSSHPRTFAAVLIAGLATFHEPPTMEWVLKRLTPSEMQAVEPIIADEIARLSKDRSDLSKKITTNGHDAGGDSEAGN